MINFITPGVLDLRCITTFGTNVKPNSSDPIGYFGTGLKYAISILLREGQKISLTTDGKSYTFNSKTDSIRGKEFAFCEMFDVAANTYIPLPFTLDLGKDWTLENAYRELYSNTADEKGTVTDLALDRTSHEEGSTVFSIEGSSFDYVHKNRDSFILRKGLAPVWKSDQIEILPFASNVIFYRGIAAHSLYKPSRFTYNILKHMSLTENRTLYDWEVGSIVKQAIGTCNVAQIIETTLTDHANYESDLDFTYSEKSDFFLNEVGKLIKTAPNRLSPSATRAFFNSHVQEVTYKEVDATPEQKKALDGACVKILSCGIPMLSFPIVLAEHLGKGVLALAYQKKIWLTAACFESEALLISALLEEYVHLRYLVSDETRAMQNAIFSLLTRVIIEKSEGAAQQDAAIQTEDIPF